MLNPILFLAGLSGVRSNLVTNWIGPAALIVIAGYAIYFLINRNFRMLASFIIIGAIVAVLIYGTETFFGENGIFTNTVKETAKSVQVITPNSLE